MHFLLITLGSRGDINPFIGLGLALKKRGHGVTIITSEIYEKLLVDLGLGFIACTTKEEYLEAIHNPDLYDAKKSFPVIAKMLLDPMSGLYEILSRFDPNTTILVATALMLGARIAHEKLHFRLATICLQPQIFWSAEQPAVLPTGSKIFQRLPFFLRKILYALGDRFYIDRALAPGVNRFRFKLGLPKVHNIFSKWIYSPQKVIGLFPEWLTPPRADWPSPLKLPGFLQYDENPEELLAPEILKFLAAGEAPLVFTYGTFMTQGYHFFKTSLEAARKLGRRSLILTQHPEQLPDLNPEKEMHLSYVPLQKLLPHVAAIVHHGGIGTIAQALAAGVPQLIVPMAYDQPDNAFRLEKLGVSLSIPREKYSLDHAVKSLQKLLDSPEIKAQCMKYSKKIDFKQAEQSLCEELEEMGRRALLF